MADNIKENIFVIQSDEGEGIIQLADYVVTSIVALAVTEVDGVSKLTGDITRDLIAMLGKKSLSKGIRVVYDENKLRVAVSVEIK